MTRKTTKLWLGRLLLATVVPLFCLELALQVGALFTPNAPSQSSAAATPDATAAEPCAVLCMGDSFTFGIGASNSAGSYPAQLQALLRAAPVDGRWRVANCGVPGRNSRELLLDLPRQMKREQPRFVVVLVGINDTWSRPERADIAEAARDAGLSSPWHFEWRTRKLLKLLLNTPKGRGLFAGDEPRGVAKRATAAKVASAKPDAKRPDVPKRRRSDDVQHAYDFAGSWRSAGGETIRFARDGGGSRGAVALHWRLARAGELVLRLGEDQPGAPAIEIHVAAKRRGERLLLTLADGSAPVVFDGVPDSDGGPPKPPPPDWYPEFAKLTAAGKLADALAWTERWIATEPDDSSAWVSHLAAASRLERSDLFAADLERIERIHRDRGTCESAENLAYGYDLANQPERAAALVREEVPRFPESMTLLTRLAQAHDREGDLEGAVRVMDRAIDGDDGTPTAYLGFKYRERARWNDSLQRGVAAARDVVLAQRADPDAKLLLQLLLRGTFDEANFDEAFALTDATDDEQAAIRQRLAEAREARSAAPPRHLADHLTQIVRWVRDQGAEPLFCDYPFRDGTLEKVQRRVAAREHVRLVEITARFDQLLATRAHQELFVPDGHCNDEGYRFMAEEVAAALHEGAH